MAPKKSEGLTAHIFRHNYCTELCYQVMKGRITIKKVADLIGDSVDVAMRVYSHIIPEKEDMNTVVADLENVLTGTDPEGKNETSSETK